MQFLGFWWPTSGLRDNGSATFVNVGRNGIYWSASPHSSNSNYAYLLDFASGYVNPVGDSGRSFGFSVRCVQE